MANLGLIVPIVLAAIFHNEPLRMTDMFLIGNFILMLWMFKHGMSIANDFSDNAHPWRYIALLIAVFLCNGLLMFGFKLNEMLHPANKACFVAAFYCGACMVFILTWWTFWFLNRGCLILLRACELKWGVLMGASTIAAVFLLQLAISLPAIVVFPVAQGIALIGGVVLMALIYKERINKFKVIEAILGLMVIIQAVFR
jgi:hypothetical protein